jgi:hypothetical protein
VEMADVQGRARHHGRPIPTRDSAEPTPANRGNWLRFAKSWIACVIRTKSIARSSLQRAAAMVGPRVTIKLV